ncbi:hypothetical protein JCM10207_005673 [Rhodosporidiobolus poonsookiae]
MPSWRFRRDGTHPTLPCTSTKGGSHPLNDAESHEPKALVGGASSHHSGVQASPPRDTSSLTNRAPRSSSSPSTRRARPSTATLRLSAGPQQEGSPGQGAAQVVWWQFWRSPKFPCLEEVDGVMWLGVVIASLGILGLGLYLFFHVKARWRDIRIKEIKQLEDEADPDYGRNRTTDPVGTLPKLGKAEAAGGASRRGSTHGGAGGGLSSAGGNGVKVVDKGEAGALMEDWEGTGGDSKGKGKQRASSIEMPLIPSSSSRPPAPPSTISLEPLGGPTIPRPYAPYNPYAAQGAFYTPSFYVPSFHVPAFPPLYPLFPGYPCFADSSDQPASPSPASFPEGIPGAAAPAVTVDLPHLDEASLGQGHLMMYPLQGYSRYAPYDAYAAQGAFYPPAFVPGGPPPMPSGNSSPSTGVYTPKPALPGSPSIANSHVPTASPSTASPSTASFPSYALPQTQNASLPRPNAAAPLFTPAAPTTPMRVGVPEFRPTGSPFGLAAAAESPVFTPRKSAAIKIVNPKEKAAQEAKAKEEKEKADKEAKAAEPVVEEKKIEGEKAAPAPAAAEEPKKEDVEAATRKAEEDAAAKKQEEEQAKTEAETAQLNEQAAAAKAQAAESTEKKGEEAAQADKPTSKLAIVDDLKREETASVDPSAPSTPGEEVAGLHVRSSKGEAVRAEEAALLADEKVSVEQKAPADALAGAREALNATGSIPGPAASVPPTPTTASHPSFIPAKPVSSPVPDPTAANAHASPSQHPSSAAIAAARPISDLSAVSYPEAVTVLHAPSMRQSEAERRAKNSLDEFFSVKNVLEGVASVEALPKEFRGILVSALADAALKKKADAVNLTKELFGQVVEKGIVAHDAMLAAFEPVFKTLVDTAMDAPSAYQYASILANGSGLSRDEIETLAQKMESEDGEEEAEDGREQFWEFYAYITHSSP